MKSDEIHVFATSMFCHLEKVAYGFEAAGACELRSDIVERNQCDRINFDLAFLHPVSPACLHVGPLPYTNAAGDLTRSDAVAQILYEQHAISLERDIAIAYCRPPPAPVLQRKHGSRDENGAEARERRLAAGGPAGAPKRDRGAFR